jgi:hypothetical protein
MGNRTSLVAGTAVASGSVKVKHFMPSYAKQRICHQPAKSSKNSEIGKKPAKNQTTDSRNCLNALTLGQIGQF